MWKTRVARWMSENITFKLVKLVLGLTISVSCWKKYIFCHLFPLFILDCPSELCQDLAIVCCCDWSPICDQQHPLAWKHKRLLTMETDRICKLITVTEKEFQIKCLFCFTKIKQKKLAENHDCAHWMHWRSVRSKDLNQR